MSARVRIGGAAVALLTIGLIWSWFSLPGNATRYWEQAAAAADAGDWVDALSLAERAMRSRQASAGECAMAGRYALNAGQIDRAKLLFHKIDDRDPEASSAWNWAGAAWLAAGRVNPAELAFRNALRVDSSNREARLALAELLRLSGRYFELRQETRWLVLSGECPSALLFAVAWPDKIWLDEADRQTIDNAVLTDPEAAWISMAKLSADALTADALRQAQRKMREIAEGSTARSEATARWGTLLVESGSWDEVPLWHEFLTSDDRAHPQVWYVLGLWQQKSGNQPAAIRCFWEALERDQFHAGASYQLSQLLPKTESRELAAYYGKHSRKLGELRQQVVFGKGTGSFPDADVLHRIVGILNDLGRHWEVWGWSALAAARHPGENWPERAPPVSLTQIPDDFGESLRSERLTQRARLDHFPSPNSARKVTGQQPARDDAGNTTVPTIAFEDVATRKGLRFRYTNGSSVAKPLGLMYEISGGGAGILDYDLDGWPDVLLTQGGPALSRPRDVKQTDTLFRNELGESVGDIGLPAGLRETGYGQGVAVGDLNSDGFPDLFVANIGPNQIWINQGDGTFRDGTREAGLAGAVWTMSAALADLNGDALADIFEVNYIGGAALSQTCQRDGQVIQCRPSLFPAVPDRIWLNLGDGRFEDVSQQAGIDVLPGKGMGIVLADFDGTGRLSAFVSNDMEPNAFFWNQTAERGPPPRFIEQGLDRGLAVGDGGLPLASMGIGAGDVDQDGGLDLSVTNFLSESSNMYLQDSAGIFLDAARQLATYEKSLPVMGWGTQFLDADLDGWPDLIVANGHLEDYSRWKIPSRMPTQVFRNRNGRAFQLVSEEQLGPYFRGRYLGRTVVRFDGNRDGRLDVLVTHVDAPVAWLENNSSWFGHHIAIGLVGTTSQRDAIGTRLKLSVGDRTLTQQLCAGDGFQASNQRQVMFGLASAITIPQLEVDWPSGLRQEFHNLPVDREIILREGADHWIEVAAPARGGRSSP